MTETFSRAGEYLLGLKKAATDLLSTPTQFSEYTILFIPEGKKTTSKREYFFLN